MTDDLRDALQRLASPTASPVGATRHVLGRLDVRRRRRRRRTTWAAAGVTAVVLVAGGLAVGLDRDHADHDRDDGAAAAADAAAGAPSTVTRLPESPLTPRHESVGAWTGTELVVVGGTTGFVCPPAADCDVIDPATYERDGAAYDPASGTWRRIADAPAPVADASAVWSGEEVVVTARAGVFAYDPDDDTWRTLDAQRVPGLSAPPLVTDQGIVYASYDQGANGTSPDLVLDPAGGTWSRLPRDPFGESYDRSVAWDGERLWLLSMSVDEHFGAHQGSPARLAVLEGGLADGTWRVVDDATPELTYGSMLWWSDGRLVVTGVADGRALVRDPDSGSWTAVTGTPKRGDGCEIPPVGVGDAGWIGGGGPALVSADGTSSVVPECPGLAAPDVAVWAGADLLVWGGPDTTYDAGTALGYRAGATPLPCPATLPRGSLDGDGFGTSTPATAAPSLPEPGTAWVCAYGSYDVAAPDDGARYEWRLDRGPQRLGAGGLARVTDDLTGLRPPPDGDHGCDGDLGPRYLVSYRTDGGPVGVLVDDFGCRDVRLTDDPATVVAGSPTSDDARGLVPGVLTAPDGFVERLAAALS